MPARSKAMARGDDKQGLEQAEELEIGEIVAALLSAEADRCVFLARDEVRAAAIARAAGEGAGETLVLLLPASDALPGDAAPASPAVAGQRTATLRRLTEGVTDGRKIILVSSAEAAGRLLPPPQAFAGKPPLLEVGEELDLETFRAQALEVGYIEDDRVDEPGEVAVRGSVIDLYPGDLPEPVRVEVTDGRIVGIRFYDPLTQLTSSDLERIEVGTVAEPDARDGVTLLDHLPDAMIAAERGVDRRRRRFLALAADAARRAPQRALADICSDERWQEALRDRQWLDLAAGRAEPPPRFIEKRAPEREFVRFAKPLMEQGRSLVLLGSPRDLRFLMRRVARAFKRPVQQVGSWTEVLAAPTGSLLALAMAVPRGFAHGLLVGISAADLIGSRAEQEAGGATNNAVQAFAAPSTLR